MKIALKWKAPPLILAIKIPLFNVLSVEVIVDKSTALISSQLFLLYQKLF